MVDHRQLNGLLRFGSGEARGTLRRNHVVGSSDLFRHEVFAHDGSLHLCADMTGRIRA